jgi:hypothetical protein
MRVLYYVTSHGYGHAVRSVAVCGALYELLSAGGAGGLSLTFCTDVPQAFFEEELPFPHGWRRGGFDVGCLQSDGVSVLVSETLEAYRGVSADNRRLLEGEARWCRDNGVDCVVGDITPFAFEVAERAGVPSVAIGNFTWHDIYAPYVERYPDYGGMLSEMAWQYGMASVDLALYPAAPMPVFGRRKAAPVLGRRGENRRTEICRHFGIDPGRRLGVVYTGNFGLGRVDWRRLESFEGWDFVGVYPLPGGPENYHVVSKERFRYQDLPASADAIVAKMGYGVFSESLLNGIPLIYPPREDFAEFPVLDAEARKLGSGVCVGMNEFCELGWSDVLDAAVDGNRMEPYACEGAMTCAEEIVKLKKDLTLTV